MKLKELINTLQIIYDHSKGTHHLKGKEPEINFWLDNPADLLNLKIDEIEPSRVPGCGCWEGAIIIFEIDKNENE